MKTAIWRKVRKKCSSSGILLIIKLGVVYMLGLTVTKHWYNWSSGSEEDNNNVVVSSGRLVGSFSLHGESSQHVGRNKFRKISQHLDGRQANLQVVVWSGRQYAGLSIDGILLINDTRPGIHVFVLNQATGSLMAHQTFSEESALKNFVDAVSPGRLLIMTVSKAIPRVTSALRKLLQRKGSLLYSQLASNSLWVYVSYAKVGRLKENIDNRGGSKAVLNLTSVIKLGIEEEPLCPYWMESTETGRRRKFCQQVEGYPNVCSCHNASPVSFQTASVHPWFHHSTLPIVIMSTNKPHYLYRTLTSLLSLNHLNQSSVSVVLAGYYEEPKLICELLQVQYSQYKLISDSKSNLYRMALTDTFSRHPKAEYVILLEDDIDISPDFLDYFNHTIPLLSKQSNQFFCISAWNDQNFLHTSQDPIGLYLVDNVPLRAVALRRQTWETELNTHWPEEAIELSQWLRVMMAKRHCVRPVLSRIYPFGTSNTMIQISRQPSFQTSHRSFTYKLDNFTENLYDDALRNFLKTGTYIPINLFNKCKQLQQFVANKNATTFVFRLHQFGGKSVQKLWSKITRCFSLSSKLSCVYKGLCWIRMRGARSYIFQLTAKVLLDR